MDLFCEASGGDKAGLAAVLFDEGQIAHTSMKPNEAMMKTLQERNDQQIMALELHAIVLGVCTFREKLKGKNVRIWCDNAGGENVLRAGTARSEDHNLIVHGIWLHALRCNYGICVERVCSKQNIADLPSRGTFEVLEAMGSTTTAPCIDDAFFRPKEWKNVAMN